MTGLKWLRSNLSTTRYDLTSDRPMWEIIWKKFFTFDFHILPEHRRIGDKIFAVVVFQWKTAIIHEVGVDPFT